MVIMSANVLVRVGVQALLQTQAYIQLVGEAKSVHDVEDLIAREKPHVVMLETEGDPNVLDSVHKLSVGRPEAPRNCSATSMIRKIVQVWATVNAPGALLTHHTR